MNTTRATLTAACLLAAATACGNSGADTAATSTTPEKPRLYTAADACGVIGARDNGRTITVSTAGEKHGMGHTIADALCLLEKLDTPADVNAHISQTRALDGMQTDEWDGYRARWTYHPDDGLNITIVDQRR